MDKTIWEDFVEQCTGLVIYKEDFNTPLTITKDLIEFWELTTIENTFNLIQIKAEDNPIVVSYKNDYKFIGIDGETVHLDLMFLKPFLVN